MVGELDIGPSVGGKSDDAGLSPFVEGGEWKEAHLILLSFVLVSLHLEIPVIVVNEIPCCNRLVV